MSARHSKIECKIDKERRKERERGRASPVEIRNYDTFGQTESTLKYVIRELVHLCERERGGERERESECSLNGI